MSQHEFEPGTTIEGYFVQKKIGHGISGIVYTAVSEGNMKVVLKCFNLKSGLRQKEYDTEVLVLSKYRKDPNVVTMYDHFVFGSWGVIVLERLEMDLVTFLETRELTEEEAKRVFKQVCLAIENLHFNNIAHMDIKPDNIFLNDINSICVGDFGGCFEWSEDTLKLGRSGTMHYCAPEVSKKLPYRADKADIWSLGILLHVLASGFYPYSARNDRELDKKISKGKVMILKSYLPKDKVLHKLIKSMLTYDATKRPTINEVLSCPWLEGVEVKQVTLKRKKILRSSVGKRSTSSFSQPMIPDVSDINECGNTTVEINGVTDRFSRRSAHPSSIGKSLKRPSWSATHILSSVVERLKHREDLR